MCKEIIQNPQSLSCGHNAFYSCSRTCWTQPTAQDNGAEMIDIDAKSDPGEFHSANGHSEHLSLEYLVQAKEAEKMLARRQRERLQAYKGGGEGFWRLPCMNSPILPVTELNSHLVLKEMRNEV
ncbi:hypothetical protein Clacol_010071 [Clathrus columnatus]|uniref:Uncharacterized protein n=1 Tax=Clathrus columnatus TaxID=1419009 RepID=A0AAV5AT33_9AGAM|nr:hypothetical protein Clacol_010071 [Clathrus columnatus]